jgi:hypothetical protein
VTSTSLLDPLLFVLTGYISQLELAVTPSTRFSSYNDVAPLITSITINLTSKFPSHQIPSSRLACCVFAQAQV